MATTPTHGDVHQFIINNTLQLRHGYEESYAPRQSSFRLRARDSAS